MKHRAVFITFFVILSIVYLDLLRPNQINSITLVDAGDHAKVLIEQTKNIVPITIFKKSENCWVFDFRKTLINNKLLKKSFANSLIKMCFVSRSKEDSNIARLRIYVCDNSKLKVSELDDKLVITIAKKENFTGQESDNTSIGLLNPSDKKSAPVLIDIKGKSLYPILHRLAENIGVKLKFKNDMPNNVSIKLEASDSAEAIYGIASLLGISIEKKGNTWALMRLSKIYE